MYILTYEIGQFFGAPTNTTISSFLPKTFFCEIEMLFLMDLDFDLFFYCWGKIEAISWSVYITPTQK